jgi:hypothetical protein
MRPDIVPSMHYKCTETSMCCLEWWHRCIKAFILQVATRDFKPGDVVVKESPYAHVVSESEAENICSATMSEVTTEQGSLCGGCRCVRCESQLRPVHHVALPAFVQTIPEVTVSYPCISYPLYILERLDGPLSVRTIALLCLWTGTQYLKHHITKRHALYERISIVMFLV